MPTKTNTLGRSPLLDSLRDRLHEAQLPVLRRTAAVEPVGPPEVALSRSRPTAEYAKRPPTHTVRPELGRRIRAHRGALAVGVAFLALAALVAVIHATDPCVSSTAGTVALVLAVGGGTAVVSSLGQGVVAKRLGVVLLVLTSPALLVVLLVAYLPRQVAVVLGLICTVGAVMVLLHGGTTTCS